jgi:Mce-associated membrane protein
VLSVCALALATVVAGETWYLWGVSDPTPTAERPVTTGDIAARSVVETAAQDAAAIFTVSWRTYDAHLDRVSGLMTGAFAATYRRTAGPVKARVVAARSTTTTKVAASGVVRASEDQVVALVFLDQRVVSGNAPTYNARRALVTMVHTDRGWLVGDVQTG